MDSFVDRYPWLYIVPKLHVCFYSYACIELPRLCRLILCLCMYMCGSCVLDHRGCTSVYVYYSYLIATANHCSFSFEGSHFLILLQWFWERRHLHLCIGVDCDTRCSWFVNGTPVSVKADKENAEPWSVCLGWHLLEQCRSTMEKTVWHIFHTLH